MVSKISSTQVMLQYHWKENNSIHKHCYHTEQIIGLFQANFQHQKHRKRTKLHMNWISFPRACKIITLLTAGKRQIRWIFPDSSPAFCFLFNFIFDILRLIWVPDFRKKKIGNPRIFWRLTGTEAVWLVRQSTLHHSRQCTRAESSELGSCVEPPGWYETCCRCSAPTPRWCQTLLSGGWCNPW